ncbi:MAG: hypothetical protein K6T75_03815 [Acetobacteraceae bacterium]|nr:hypothetical protein [Acetobacteraceae bacterium]
MDRVRGPRAWVIPAIDILGGRAVRLVRGDPGRPSVVDPDPVRLARYLRAQGARALHVIDLDGAREGSPVNLALVRKVVRSAAVPVQVGGGVRSPEDAAALLRAGVWRVVLGTMAAEDPEGLLAMRRRFGDAVIPSLDVRAGQVATRGWSAAAGRSPLEVAEALLQGGFRLAVFTIATGTAP